MSSHRGATRRIIPALHTPHSDALSARLELALHLTATLAATALGCTAPATPHRWPSVPPGTIAVIARVERPLRVGRFEVWLDDRRVFPAEGQDDDGRDRAVPAFVALPAPLAPGPHGLEVRAVIDYPCALLEHPVPSERVYAVAVFTRASGPLRIELDHEPVALATGYGVRLRVFGGVRPQEVWALRGPPFQVPARCRADMVPNSTTHYFEAALDQARHDCNVNMFVSCMAAAVEFRERIDRLEGDARGEIDCGSEFNRLMSVRLLNDEAPIRCGSPRGSFCETGTVSGRGRECPDFLDPFAPDGRGMDGHLRLLYF